MIMVEIDDNGYLLFFHRPMKENKKTQYTWRVPVAMV
jgi:hypothetical protein